MMLDSKCNILLCKQTVINLLGYISRYPAIDLVRFFGVLNQNYQIAFIPIGEINHSCICCTP